MLEKPFGHDLQSAKQLNEIVSQVFDEDAVYRIDHYLGKETVQNIMVFRFGNPMFEPIWNRNYIDYVEITAAENLGVENRAAVLRRDWRVARHVANHMLQLSDVDGDGATGAYDEQTRARQKVQVLTPIGPIDRREVSETHVRGQYGRATSMDKSVPGYRQEQGVNPASNTETYVAVEFHVDNWRWAGVPFYVRAGKRLPNQLTEIAVHFNRTPQAVVSSAPGDVHHNVLPCGLADEGISIDFEAKVPGSQMRATG